jgi:hypothetical protein
MLVHGRGNINTRYTRIISSYSRVQEENRVVLALSKRARMCVGRDTIDIPGEYSGYNQEK